MSMVTWAFATPADATIATDKTTNLTEAKEIFRVFLQLNDIVHPAFHSQQNTSDDGDSPPVIAVDGNLRRRTGGQLIA
jgi:hypothetical protein